MTPARAFVPCPSLACYERHNKLLLEFQQVVAEYHCMQRTQLEAVLRGEDFPFEEWVAEAAGRMAQAKFSLRAHREAHG